MPHADAVRAYAQADILVDQLLVGWYGGIAVEFMALGKPVVCFVAEEWTDRYAPAGMMADLPIVRAGPESLAGVLRGSSSRPRAELAELGRCGRAFVERWHDPLQLAARLRDAYTE